MKKLSKKELIEKWIEALRSGEYKQTVGKLVRNNKYCCLGVLCEIAKEQFNLKYLFDDNDEKIIGFETSREVYESSPPLSLQKFLGLNKRLNSSDEYIILDTLILMNDEDKKRFSTIAKYLEKELL